MATKTISSIKLLIDKQRKFFESNATRDIDFRMAQLIKFKQALQANEENIYASLHADFRKSKFEAYGTEIGVLYEEISCMLKNVKKMGYTGIGERYSSKFSIKKLYLSRALWCLLNHWSMELSVAINLSTRDWCHCSWKHLYC